MMDDDQDLFGYPTDTEMKKIPQQYKPIPKAKVITKVASHDPEQLPQYYHEGTFSFNLMFDFNQEHSKRINAGKYNDTTMNYTMNQTNVFEGNSPTHRENVDVSRILPPEEDLKRQERQDPPINEPSEEEEKDFSKISDFSRGIIVGHEDRGVIFGDSISHQKQQSEKNVEDLEGEREKEDEEMDEQIFEMDQESIQKAQKGWHENGEFLLSELLEKQEKEQEQKLQKKEKLEKYLSQIENQPMKTLQYQILYENCARVSIKAIHSPAANAHMKTTLLEERTYLKIYSKKLNLNGYQQEPQKWIIGDSKIQIKPAICSLKCFTCRTKQAEVCEFDGVFRTICSNRHCMKNITFEIVDISLI